MDEHIIATINAATAADIPVMLWGPPGVGKSSLIRSIAESQGVPCEVVVGSIREPSDFAGLPVVRDSSNTLPDVPLVPPDWARRLACAEKGILFLDELTTAPPAVQAAMLRVVLDRAVGSMELPSGVRVIAAGNPSNEAADGWDLAAPLANRFLHLEIYPNPDVFCSGMTNGWSTPISSLDIALPDDSAKANARAQVASFISRRRDLLHSIPKTESAAGKAWPSPRTWEMVATILPYLDTVRTRFIAVTGLVGEGAGIEFLSWMENNDLPDPLGVLNNPSSVDWNGRPDRVFAITASLISYFSSRKQNDKEDRKELWEQTWDTLEFAAKNGPADIIALSAKQLIELRDPSWGFPSQAKIFLSVLRDAGLTRSSSVRSS